LVVSDYATAYEGEPAHLNVDVTNSGSSLKVFASADGSDDSYARAVGIEVEGGFIDGAIGNAGLLQVTANGNGGSATAVGVIVYPWEFDGTIANTSGTIIAQAWGDGSANAVGIQIDNNGGPNGYTGTGYSTVPARINNHNATIYAAVSNDGGLSVQRGTAIDVAGAPQPVWITISGDSDIYGNIQRPDLL
jgi:hypothetical protein